MPRSPLLTDEWQLQLEKGLPIHQLTARTALFRVYFRESRHPSTWNAFRFFGPASARFDHHEEPPHVQERGILYAATHPLAALAEVFQAGRLIDVRTDEPWLVAFRLAQPVQLLDLLGLWPTRAGASAAISSGPRPTARRWARLIYASYTDAQGLWYGSSMAANTPCVALFERAAAALPTAPAFHHALADATLEAFLVTTAATLGYRLAI
jgi:RES domain-containing protein